MTSHGTSYTRQDRAPGARHRNQAARLVGDLDQRHARGLAGVDQPSLGRQRPALRHDGAQEPERDLGRRERSRRRQGGLDRASQRRVHQDAEGGAGDDSLREQQPVGHRHGERHAAGLDRGEPEPEQVANRGAKTAFQHAAEQVEPGQGHELPGVGVEPANRFFPDRRLGGWTGLPGIHAPHPAGSGPGRAGTGLWRGCRR